MRSLLATLGRIIIGSNEREKAQAAHVREAERKAQPSEGVSTPETQSKRAISQMVKKVLSGKR